ncbi:MAG: hypothetical protein DRJ56_07830 [Thermoprotei archaeon]|nr:MAG: hypothetical protein DRJ56_07830 [Thermoprotei archaeon]
MTGAWERLRLVESLVKLPLYSAVGVTSGRLVYSSNVEGVRDLWSLDLSTGSSVRLTRGGVSAVAAVRPNSPLVVYAKDVGAGRELHQVFCVDVWGGEERAIEGMEPRRVFGVEFDGEIVAVSAASERSVELWVMRPGGEAERVHKTRSIIVVSDVGGGKVVGHGVLRGDPRAFELFVFDLESLELEVFTPREGSLNRAPRLWGSKLLFATTALGRERLVVYDLETKELAEPELRYRDHEGYDFTEYVTYGWTADGRVWFVGKRDGRTRAFVDGREVPLPEGCVTNLVPAGSRVYATHSSLASPHSVYEVDLESGKRRVLLGAELPREAAERIGRAYMVRYKSADGLEVPAFVVESRAAPRPGPTVVYVHGGPWADVADSWNVMIASLAALGYHVVAPNFRGSTGYGEEFRRMIIGDPGGGDLADVVSAAEWARASGLADRVAIMGYSYGGYMTLLALTKRPDVWSAGCAGAGIADWEEMYELSDALYKSFIGVLFAGRSELFRERSPITYVEGLKAPVCIVHPQNDTRTPLRPVLRLVERLLELGKTFELHVIPDAGHAIVKVEDALKVLLPMALFLDRYLRSGGGGRG